ncbi:MAG TPA: hypothetical protein VLM91_07055 [Candidatus Methylomirabilis sp.]|nr:hypothetical protein [Candidatus Methylomirabilis sp.]
MDVYGKLAGDIALAEEQVAKLNTLATKARPTWGFFLLTPETRRWNWAGAT